MSEPLPCSPERMTAADTALLVIDVQERLAPAIRDSKRVVWNCRRLLDAARVVGLPVAVTEQNPDKLGRTVPELLADASLKPFHKMVFSSGACGEIFSVWRERGVERVLLCGIETHVCVAQTALDLLAAGYQVIVAADAVGSRAALDHEIALRRLDSSGAVITTFEAAAFEWCARAGTPEFRQVSALVKQAPPES